MSSKSEIAPKGPTKLKPTVFGRYLLLDRVASGGMAEVWRAKVFGADDFQRIIAIKKILPHVVEDPEFVQMFKDEARITVELQHANIAQTYEFNKVDDTFYIAMEYVSGKDAKTLWSYQRQRGSPLPISVSCMIVQKMCEGLDYAHRKRDNFGTELKIVHRDVSPQNVLISWEGEVKIIDFGIAKAAGKASKTQAGILKGKFGYMAPEQVRGLPIDQRADVFALGVCLYELLTGERAFLADSDFSLLEMVRNVEIKPPSLANNRIPQELERIIYKALAKDPADRYPWASELSEELQRFMLMSGKSPSRNDLVEYLRANFTADHEKERIRMETYRSVEMPDLSAPRSPSAVTITPPPPNPGADAVHSALLDDMDGVVPGVSMLKTNPATVVPMPPVGFADPRRSVTGSNPFPTRGTPLSVPLPPGAIRPPAQPQFSPPQPAPTPVQPHKNLKLVVVGSLVFLGVLALAGTAVWALRGSGTVAISTQPDGAEVFLDGESKGVTKGDLVIKNVPVGPHLLRVVKPQYIPFSVSIQVGRSTLFTETIKLERQEFKGQIHVRSQPPGATIWVDGVNTEKITPVNLELEAGPHTVEVRLNRFQRQDKKVNVEAEKRDSVEFRLKPELVNLKIVTIPNGAKVYDTRRTLLGTTPFVFENLSINPPFPELVFRRSGCQDTSTTVYPDETSPEGDQTFKSITLKCR